VIFVANKGYALELHLNSRNVVFLSY